MKYLMPSHIFILFLLLVPNLIQADSRYTLAIVPQTSATLIEKKWNPLIRHIEEETGITLELIHHKSIPHFEESLAAGTPDFSYMNPYHAYRAYEMIGYQPVIRDNNKLLLGQLWVREDSPIKTVDQLEGKNLVFPAPNAFGASLYMRALLTNEYGLNFNTRYVKTHSNVYRHIGMGRADAGGGVKRTYNAEPVELQKSLRLLFETPKVRPHPICVHPRVSKEDYEKVVQAILALSESDKQTLLDTIAIPVPARANYEEDYAPLGKLKLSDFAEGAMK